VPEAPNADIVISTAKFSIKTKIDSRIIAHIVAIEITLLLNEIDLVSLKSRMIFPNTLWFNSQV